MDQFAIILGIIGLAVISPGADFAMVSRLSFMDGRRAGLLAAVGIALGCWFHVAYGLFGLGLVERFWPNLLDALKIAGAVYLVYLGASMALARPAPTDGASGPVGGAGFRALRTGFLTNALNPKTSVFVVSLYAQVIGRDTPLAVQFGYGAVISLCHLVWFAAVAMTLSRPAIRSRILTHQRAVNAGIGAVLVVLGLVLGFADLGRAARP